MAISGTFSALKAPFAYHKKITMTMALKRANISQDTKTFFVEFRAFSYSPSSIKHWNKGPKEHYGKYIPSCGSK